MKNFWKYLGLFFAGIFVMFAADRLQKKNAGKNKIKQKKDQAKDLNKKAADHKKKADDHVESAGELIRKRRKNKYKYGKVVPVLVLILLFTGLAHGKYVVWDENRGPVRSLFL